MARSFNGTSQWLNANTSFTFNAADLPYSYTLSAWFLATGTATAYDVFNIGTAGTSASDSNADQLRILLNNSGAGKMDAQARLNAGSGMTATAGGTFSANTWNHGVAIFNGTSTPNVVTATAYLNGAGKTSSGASNTSGLRNSGCAVGALIFANSTQFNYLSGSVADAAIWNVQLTDAEVLALAKGARPWTIRPSALVAWFPLDGLASPEVDLSGKKNNQTLNGGPILSSSGPPVMMFTPRWPQNIVGAAAAAAASGIHFRRTLSPLGTRAGSRQVAA